MINTFEMNKDSIIKALEYIPHTQSCPTGGHAQAHSSGSQHFVHRNRERARKKREIQRDRRRIHNNLQNEPCTRYLCPQYCSQNFDSVVFCAVVVYTGLIYVLP